MKNFTFLKKQALLFVLLLASFFSFAQTYETGITVSTFAGSTNGYVDDTGAAAQFSNPWGVAVDASGNLYVADSNNHKIRKITPAGVVTTFAGSTQGYADGTGTAAMFNGPSGPTVDASGNVYVADRGNHKIRKITPTGDVTTLAGSTAGYVDGTGTTAQFNYPYGVAVDASGIVYVADYTNHKIRKITPAGVVTTLAGSTQGYADNITGTSAQFNYPIGLTVDASGIVYVADRSNHKIRKITPAGEVTTLAGSTYGYVDGAGNTAQFYNPYSVAVDASGAVYVADLYNHKIRKITPAGVVTTVAGTTQGYTDGTGTAAQFYYPIGVAVDNTSGNIYVADYGNNRIRKITASATHLNFDGVDDFVVSAGAITNNTQNQTYQAWFKIPSIPTDRDRILQRGNDGSGGWSVQIDVNSTGKLTAGISVLPSDIGITGITVINPNTWYQATFVFENNNSLRLYLNGNLEASVAIGNNTLRNSDNRLRIGTGNVAVEFFRGDIDDVRVWDIALTATDIMNTLNCEAQVQPELAAYYKFNQGIDSADNTAVNTLTDASGNGNNGTLTNFALTGATSNWKSGSPITTGNTCAVLSTASYTQVGGFTVYPNPSNGIFSIETLTNATITVFDMVGKQIATQKVAIGTATVNLSSFTAGVYFAKITTEDNQTQTVKLIKE